MNFAGHVKQFNANLSLSSSLPAGVEVMNPFLRPETRAISEQFFDKYYGDNEERTYLFGINPGRFGAGITGVCFTDPIKLESLCGIPNPFKKQTELSADFIYQMIEAYGGPERFYSRFFITAICPLGFVRNGKNLNYYDDKQLIRDLRPFIHDSITRQLEFGANRETAFCIGEGENYRFFKKLNNEKGYFKHIEPLPHPRFILQYRRKRVQEYIDIYLQKLGNALR